METFHGLKIILNVLCLHSSQLWNKWVPFYFVFLSFNICQIFIIALKLGILLKYFNSDCISFFIRTVHINVLLHNICFLYSCGHNLDIHAAFQRFSCNSSPNPSTCRPRDSCTTNLIRRASWVRELSIAALLFRLHHCCQPWRRHKVTELGYFWFNCVEFEIMRWNVWKYENIYWSFTLHEN